MVLSSLTLAGSTAALGATVSSAACINEADFQAGTVVEYESRDNVSPVTSRNKTETLGREDFAGTSPVASLHTTFMNNSPIYLTTTFAQIKDGQLIRYGDRHGAGASLTTTFYNPPPATPVDLQPGQTVTVSYKSQVVSSGVKLEFEVTEKLTYNGRETIKTPLGTFETCRFTNEISTGPASAKEPKQKVMVQNWFAAEGPYRGQSIKSVSPSGKDGQDRVVEVVKMRYETRSN
ncbi:DUF3108 domain-containing protein [Pseudomonas fuscovaginae UPB0736]|uniref:hypothetical protein n=1 Tax=Pseudomonas asplenii TaxID=53407 RepID=UPI0002885564|nr:hypothetical protein [Pseudomonas fuscovaginae]UUQ67837.1 DUF3108 domain-containing protein [Pseudomonas fuscovaginae UPB0736]